MADGWWRFIFHENNNVTGIQRVVNLISNRQKRKWDCFVVAQATTCETFHLTLLKIDLPTNRVANLSPLCSISSDLRWAFEMSLEILSSKLPEVARTQRENTPKIWRVAGVFWSLFKLPKNSQNDTRNFEMPLTPQNQSKLSNFLQIRSNTYWKVKNHKTPPKYLLQIPS